MGNSPQRVTCTSRSIGGSLKALGKTSGTAAEPHEAPQNPRRATPQRPLRTPESLGEGCAPRMVTLWNFGTRSRISWFEFGLEFRVLDDCQITHLVCVHLKHLLCDFLWGVLGPLYKKKQQEGGPKHPPKSLLANVLGGHRFWRSFRSFVVS